MWLLTQVVWLTQLKETIKLIRITFAVIPSIFPEVAVFCIKSCILLQESIVALLGKEENALAKNIPESVSLHHFVSLRLLLRRYSYKMTLYKPSKHYNVIFLG